MTKKDVFGSTQNCEMLVPGFSREKIEEGLFLSNGYQKMLIMTPSLAHSGVPISGLIQHLKSYHCLESWFLFLLIKKTTILSMLKLSG